MTAPSMHPAWRPVLDLLAVAELPEEARAAAGAGDDARAVVQRMVEAGHTADAIAFVAHALPKREGVWWAWITARRAVGESPPQPVAHCLAATEAWIAQPTDAHRRLAFAHAQAVGIGTPAGCAALAAFLCGESLAPPDVQAVPPNEFDAAKAITGAIMLSGAADPAKMAERLATALQQGLDVVEKIKLWPPAGGGAA